MSKVILPFVEPMYSTYHWLSNAGIPAKQNSTSDNWYFNETVDLKCSRRFLHGLTTPKVWVEVGSLWQIPFFDKGGVSTRFAQYCTPALVRAMIDEGFYVAFAGVDDFYVKGKSFYQERHFAHDGLIIGYDDEDETFILAAYDQRWLFTTFKTPQQCFIEGMKALCKQGEYAGLTAVKALDTEITLDLPLIIAQFHRFLDSNLDLYPVESPDDVHGLMVYDYICMYLDKLTDGSVHYDRKDRRFFRMLWEHKRCMHLRIKAIEKEYGWDDEFSSTYETVLNMANKAQFLYSKFSLKFSFSIPEKLQMLLLNMKQKEKEVLRAILAKIED